MKPKKDTIVPTRFTQDEVDQIRRAATKRGISKFIRDAVAERLSKNVIQDFSPKKDQKR